MSTGCRPFDTCGRLATHGCAAVSMAGSEEPACGGSREVARSFITRGLRGAAEVFERAVGCHHVIVQWEYPTTMLFQW